MNTPDHSASDSPLHYQQQYHKPTLALADSVAASLCAASWPGNVRALRHACERAVILSTSSAYQLADFGLHAPREQDRAIQPDTHEASEPDSFKLDTLERDTVIAAMAKVEGNISHAAKLLGVSRAALYRKLARHGL